MSQSRVEKYSFVLVLERTSHEISVLEETLFEAGCDDALLGTRNGSYYLDFDRAVANFDEAVASAIHAVESTDLGLRVKRIEPDDPVTAAEIARRVGASREAVRLWIEGKRGSGDFPAPRAGLSGSTVLWSWREVARWLVATRKTGSPGLVEQAETIAAFNRALEAREEPLLEKRSALLQRSLGRP